MRNPRYVLVFILALLLSTGMILPSAWAKHDQKIKRLEATIDADGVQRVSVIGGEYYFDPNLIIVKVNVPVEMTIKKAKGIVPHNILIDAPEAGIEFDEKMKSKEKVISFTPTKTGSYDIICSKKLLFFKSHNEKGMHGTLKVVEQ